MNRLLYAVIVCVLVNVAACGGTIVDAFSQEISGYSPVVFIHSPIVQATNYSAYISDDDSSFVRVGELVNQTTDQNDIRSLLPIAPIYKGTTYFAMTATTELEESDLSNSVAYEKDMDLPYPPYTYVSPDQTSILEDGFLVEANNQSVSTKVLRSSTIGNQKPPLDTPKGAVYNINVPVRTRVYIWGNFYYSGSDNDANSFFLTVVGPSYEEVFQFGNSKSFWNTWHWDGDGSQETGLPVPLDVGILEAGDYSIIISRRETTPVPPVLGALVLSTSSAYIPNDADALEFFGVGPTTTSIPSPTTTIIVDPTTTTIPPITTTTEVVGPTTTTTLPSSYTRYIFMCDNATNICTLETP